MFITLGVAGIAVCLALLVTGGAILMAQKTEDHLIVALAIPVVLFVWIVAIPFVMPVIAL